MTPTMPPDAATPARPRRRWWSLSVRGLMLLVLGVGGGIGWEANRVRRFRAILASFDRDIEATFADDSGGPYHHDAPQPAWVPAWCRQLVGEDHFRRVVGISLFRRPLTADWDAILALGSVESLSFSYVPVRDEDLTRLPECAGLRELWLIDAKITRNGLSLVSALPDLQTLNLFGTDLTGADLAPLARLNHLETLRLNAESAQDDGMVHLRGLLHLKTLDLSYPGSRLTDRGLAHLGGLLRLERLEFAADQVTEAGLAVLTRLPRLKSLDIAPVWKQTTPALRLSPAGVAILGEFTHLDHLSLDSPLGMEDAWFLAISRLTQLRELTLVGDQLTDAGLDPLGRMVELTGLSVQGQNLTEAGMKHLKPLSDRTPPRFYRHDQPYEAKQGQIAIELPPDPATSSVASSAGSSFPM